jgi:glycosyltransferase involved in cell wall biosynthesis
MKILHCCLANFYIDNYGYQENILPKQHKLDGHVVEILASTETYIDHKVLGYVNATSYLSESGIPITRLPYSAFLPHFIVKKLRIYKGVTKVLERFRPDIIFVHDCQFLDMRHLVKYARKNSSVKIFVDCHADFINSARNWLSKYILHKIIYRYCAKMIEPYTTKFYGVLPLRCDFLHDVYSIPKEKIELLVLGGEDDKIHVEQRNEMRKSYCSEFGFNTDDFIVVSGGKLDKQKNTIALIDAIGKVDCARLRLIIFGSVADDIKQEFEKRLNNPNIKYIGWIHADKAYDYFTIADLVIFPGLHSVLWEQAIACGVPCVFRDIKGMHHVDTGGNCKFLKTGSTEEITVVLKDIISNPATYDDMRKQALIGASQFLYSDIARRSIHHAF